MWYRHRRQGPDAVGMRSGERPGDYRPPVVAGDVEALPTLVVRDRERVGHEEVDPVVVHFGRPSPVGVAALVERKRTASLRRQGFKLVSPRPRCLRKTVQQQDGRVLRIAGDQPVEDQTVRVETCRFHGLRGRRWSNLPVH